MRLSFRSYTVRKYLQIVSATVAFIGIGFSVPAYSCFIGPGSCPDPEPFHLGSYNAAFPFEIGEIVSQGKTTSGEVHSISRASKPTSSAFRIETLGSAQINSAFSAHILSAAETSRPGLFSRTGLGDEHTELSRGELFTPAPVHEFSREFEISGRTGPQHSETPLPGTLPLMLTVLIGAVGLGFWRGLERKANNTRAF
jgi:hypothetical protein